MTSDSAARISALPVKQWNSVERSVLSEIEEIVVFALPMNVRFRGITRREGLLLRGPAGWGECAPFGDYGPAESSRWLQSALESARMPGLDSRRNHIAVNVTIPVCTPAEARSRIAGQPGCATAKVKVADPGYLTEEDVLRVRAVSRDLAGRYGSRARVRVDANTAWTVPEAATALARLDAAAQAAGGLEYAEQPVKSVREMAELRRQTNVPLAADESIRRSSRPLAVRQREAADAAVFKVAPLGGVRQAAHLRAQLGLPAVVSSALDTSIGIAAGVQLAAALPSLPFACGLNTATMFTADVVDHPLIAEDGVLDVRRAQAIRTGELTKNSVAVDSQTIARWNERLRAMIAHLETES